MHSPLRRTRRYLPEAITRIGIGASLDRIIGNAKVLAQRFKRSSFVDEERGEYADMLDRYAEELSDLADNLRDR